MVLRGSGHLLKSVFSVGSNSVVMKCSPELGEFDKVWEVCFARSLNFTPIFSELGCDPIEVQSLVDINFFLNFRDLSFASEVIFIKRQSLF